jgi:5-methylcytosine-specific restriction endonuclease McrA
MTVKELYEKVVSGKIISDIELQRAIVYDVAKQQLVIDSIYHGIPLPAFYLWENENGILEVLDGKQRIEAITKFKQNDIKYDGHTWKEYGGDPNSDLQFIVDNTELTIITCSGTEEKKREIFKRINTLGVPLSRYEVLNGLYHGEYLEGLDYYMRNNADARKVLPPASIDRGDNKYKLLEYIYYIRYNSLFPKKDELDEYVKLRKDETFNSEVDKIKPYISFVRNVFHDKSKIPALLRFKLSVKYLKDRSIWLQHKDAIWKECDEFIKSEGYKMSVTKDDDIETMILGIVNNRRVDPKRRFTQDDKLHLLSEMTPDADGLYECAICHQHFAPNELEVDHKTPWSLGGRTVLSNAQLLCSACNSRKSNRKY